MSVFGVSHNVAQRPFMPDGTMYNSYYTKYSTVAVTGVPGLVFWFLFIKAPLSRIPSDLGAVIDRYRETGVGPDFTIGDLWRARVKASMAPLEEGALPRWSHGRVLLLGDSVHKVCQTTISIPRTHLYAVMGHRCNMLSGHYQPWTRR